VVERDGAGSHDIAILALITLVIFAEKSTPFGRQIAALAAVALLFYGILVTFVPEALPMMTNDSEMMGTSGMESS
jgi:predicted metal-binding membrane protein